MHFQFPALGTTSHTQILKGSAKAAREMTFEMRYTKHAINMVKQASDLRSVNLDIAIPVQTIGNDHRGEVKAVFTGQFNVQISPEPLSSVERSRIGQE